MSNATNWIEKLPSAPMAFLLEKLLHADLLIESEMLSHEIEDFRVDYSKRIEELIKKMRETNDQILHAKTKNQATTAEARLRLFEREYQKIINLTQKVAVKCLLDGEFFVSARLGGETVIVPSHAWSGKVDWNEEKIVFVSREYSRLRIIPYERLPVEQRKLVKQYAAEDIDAQRDEAEGPGRPSSGMHLIEQKLRQREGSNELKGSLNEESRVLEEWFKRNHPDKKPITAKTIANKQRSLYRTLKGKTA